MLRNRFSSFTRLWMRRKFSTSSLAPRGFTSEELAIIAPGKVTSEHIMTAVGIAGDVISVQDRYRNQLLNMGDGIEVVDVETPNGIKKFNAEAYYQVMNLSKHWARLTRLFLRYPDGQSRRRSWFQVKLLCP